jgi:diguanylate cyclase (GGDEF)-like protein
MNSGGLRTLALAVLACVWLLLAAGPAAADSFAPGSRCHASGTKSETYAVLATQPQRWNCSDTGWSIAAERTFLRIDLAQGQNPEPVRFTTRLTRFEHMRLTAIASDGSTASRDLTEADMIPGTGDWVMSADLPRVPGRLAAVAVTIDEARHPRILSDGALTSREKAQGHPVQYELAVAALCGMLFMALLFNVVFYRVLRARFLVWHAISAACMVVLTLVTSGLVHRFVPLSLETASFLSAVSFGGGIATGMLFAADLIEPDRLDRVHRQALRWGGVWIAWWTVIYLLATGPLRPYAATFYYVSFVPVLALFVSFMVAARRRRSRAINFVIVAWAPFMLTGAMRIVSMIGLTDAPLDLTMEQHITLTWEVVVVNLGIADRLLFLRRERDRARAQAQVFEARAQRDPLTGLLNRRSIEERFGRLYRLGYRAMAVIDLDHFKAINDTHGHAVGDAALRAAAEALSQDPDIVAVRMGGEEFLLLLAGKELAKRAERCRQAIPARIAANVPGLGRLVTASMGFVEQPSETMQADFATLYGKCDRLLYEAKATGRNRAMSEKLTLFAPTRRKRPKAA